MKKLLGLVLIALAVMTTAESALAQSDAGSKARGEYNFYGGSAGRSMRAARDYSQDYRQYVRTAPAKKVNPEVAREAADVIGQYIVKSQKHMAWMRAQAAGDKVTLASLDVIDKNLTDAAKSHKAMHEMCKKENVDAEASMKCCEQIDAPLSARLLSMTS